MLNAYRIILRSIISKILGINYRHAFYTIDELKSIIKINLPLNQTTSKAVDLLRAIFPEEIMDIEILHNDEGNKVKAKKFIILYIKIKTSEENIIALLRLYGKLDTTVKL
jgi:hypothetical protein